MAEIMFSDTLKQEIPDDKFLVVAEKVGSPELGAAVVKAALDATARKELADAVRAGRWPPTMLQALSAFMGVMEEERQRQGQQPPAPVMPQPPAMPPMASPGGGGMSQPPAPTMRTMAGLPPVGGDPLSRYLGR